MNAHRARHGLALVLLLVVALATAVDAAPTAEFWEELGGSASGEGISASELGAVPEHRNTSIIIGADGRPVVAYTDWADVVVRRWNGSTWEIIGQPGGGHLPQLAMDADGRVYLAWMAFVADTQSWEVHLLVREAGADWAELGGSATGGGISGADGRANVNSFSFALGPDGTPWVAYDTTPTAGADLSVETSGIALESQQTYVKRWAGPASGWVYVGSGRDGGGAGNAPSFVVTGDDGARSLVLHSALSPALTVTPDGTPVLAFLYTTAFSEGGAPEFNGLNDDVYAVRWDGSAWVPMGPAVPAAAAGPGLGGPGGISGSAGWSVEGYLNRINRPQLIIGRDGAPVLGWGETTDVADARRMYVRRWGGTAWDGVGSASGEIHALEQNFDISLTAGLNGPLAAWSGGVGSHSSVFVLAYDAASGAWAEVGRGSATGDGISGPTRRGFTPWITVDPAGTPTVTWIEAPDTESGGQVFVRTFETRALPDLTVAALAVPATSHAGGTIAVRTTVRNVGATASPATRVQFYLSTGTARGTGDVALGSRAVSALAADAASTATTSLTLPPALEAGTYHVLAIVDEAGAVTERNEEDNLRASPAITLIPFRPALTLAAIGAPSTAAVGRTVSVTSTVRNAGPAPAGAFVVRFFLSTDETLDDADVALGTRTIPRLAANRTTSPVTRLTIPAATGVPGAYHVLGVLDGQEADGGAASAPMAVVAYRPELVMTRLTTPATTSPGRPLSITNTVRNVGPARAGSFTVRFFLSADDTLDNAVLLGARVIGSLAPGASSSTVTRLTVPAATVVSGGARVIGVVDALGQQDELDETNNVTAAAGPLAMTAWQPELALTSLSVPDAAVAGRPLAISHAVRNVGPAPAGAFLVRFFLSADDVLDDTDVLLGARSVDRLGAGAGTSAVTRLTIPAATPAPGRYRVIGVVDALGQQTEADESNNTRASTAEVSVSP